MKKPATAEKAKKMKVREVQNVMKKPASRIKANRIQARYRERMALAKAKKKEENVKNNARKAARDGKPHYKTRDKKLQKVAESAHSLAREGIRKADEGISMGLKNAKDVEDLQSEAATQKKHLADARARILRMEGGLKENQQGLKATTLLAQQNAERLDVDDRKRGYASPKRTIPGQGRVPYQGSTEKSQRFKSV